MPKNKNFGGAGFTPPTSEGGGNGIIPGRVKKVFLNVEDGGDIIREYGEYAALGGILFESLLDPVAGDNVKDSQYDFAMPLLSNQKHPPTKEEVVYIISLPSSNIIVDQSNTTAFYIRTVNMWNSIHHNAMPDNFFYDENEDNKNYELTEAGLVRNPSDGSTEINLGDDFKEKLDTKNLQLYEGDSTYEGRWGNTIRLGSTIKDSTPPNPWSDSGENGDPITIIKNGQTEEATDAWIPQVENINSDKSSIYLTSTQQIPLETPNTDYSSYTSDENTPTPPEEYAGSQVILNSGRLVFNSKEDHILLSSQKTISFGSQKGFNFDTPKNFVVKAGTTIRLGDNEKNGADEPVILGNKFLDSYTKVITKLVSLMSALPTVGMPAPFTPNAGVITTSTQCLVQLQQHLTEIEGFKSKKTYTK